MDTLYREKNTSLSQMADSTFTAFDGGTTNGAYLESPSCTNSKDEDGSYPSGAVTVLGSNLWNKTIPYDPDLKVALEFMDLEEFLNENSIPTDDSNRLSNFPQESNGLGDSCSGDRIRGSAPDLSCSFASLTTPLGTSSASNSPNRPTLQPHPSYSPPSLHDSNSSTYYNPHSDLNFLNTESKLLLEDSNDAPDSLSVSGKRRSRTPENLAALNSSLLHSVNADDKTVLKPTNTNNSTSEMSNTSSSQPFVKASEFLNFNDYSVDFHDITTNQSSCGGENQSALKINQTSPNGHSKPRQNIDDPCVSQVPSGSWESLRTSSEQCDTSASAPSEEATAQDRGRRKNQSRGSPRTPSTGLRQRRRRGITSYAEIDDDMISELCDFTTDKPEQVDDDRISSSQRNPSSKTGEKFNPRTRKFSEDELKPQPMVKKSRKQYVPPDLKDDKYWARRQKNNVAAKRSRDARRVKENQIALRASFLEEMHSKLKKQLDEANETISDLRKRLSKYEPV